MTPPRMGRAPAAAAIAVTLAFAGASPVAGASAAPRELRAASAPRHELSATQRVTLPGGSVIVRFRQRVAGMPVLGAEAVIDRGRGAAPRLVADTTRPTIERPPAARIS